MPSDRPQALVFDLGGVLVDIDFARALEAWSRHSRLPVSELRRRFRPDEAYERHERGELDIAGYCAHLAATLELDASPAAIEQGWNAIFVGEITATRRLVERARGAFHCFAFSNTNASHMATWSGLYPDMVSAFERIFASHQMGMRKPERRAFERICVLTGMAAHEMLFFDDLERNVEAAREAGLRAVLVRTPQDVAAALRPLGVAD